MHYKTGDILYSIETNPCNRREVAHYVRDHENSVKPASRKKQQSPRILHWFFRVAKSFVARNFSVCISSYYINKLSFTTGISTKTHAVMAKMNTNRFEKNKRSRHHQRNSWWQLAVLIVSLVQISFCSRPSIPQLSAISFNFFLILTISLFDF